MDVQSSGQSHMRPHSSESTAAPMLRRWALRHASPSQRQPMTQSPSSVVADVEWPPWLRREVDITNLFALFGFATDNISRHGRQIDLHARRRDPFALEEERWYVEVTMDKVGVGKGSRDYQRLMLAKRDDPSCRQMIISTTGFTGSQRNTLEKLGIICKTYAEFESSTLDLQKYAIHCRRLLQAPSASDIGFSKDSYVEPILDIYNNTSAPEASTPMNATDWISQISHSPSGVLGALLGSLGTGKTTILQRAQLSMLEAFERAPSDHPLPLYIPLSRYKHHSGRVHGLIQETLSEAGIGNYPTSVIQHLADTGRLIFFFDGLDEVHPVTSVEDILRTVENVMQFLGRTKRGVISSRTHLFESSDEELAIFGPYERRRLGEAGAKLSALLAGRGSTEIAKVRPFTRLQIEQYLTQTCGESDGKLVSSKISSIYGFDEMATTPVLLAMMKNTLPKVIEDGGDLGTVPQLELYRLYTNRWIQRDLGRAQLSPEQRMRLSAALARDLILRDEYTAPWSMIKEILHNDPSWKEKPIGENAAEVDVRNSTFLVREASDHFRFAHRSIMEYFAAESAFGELVAGAKELRQLSDGFMHFLHQHIASTWARNQSLPISKREFTTDAHFDAQLISAIAEASWQIPRSDTATRLPIDSLLISGEFLSEFRLARSDASGLRISVDRAGTVEFDSCMLRDTSLKFGSIGAVRFNNCIFHTCDMTLDEKDWGSVRFSGEPTAPLQTRVGRAWQSAAKAVERGLRAFVGGKEWRVPFECIRVFDAAVRRIGGKPRISVNTWAKGGHADVLVAILPGLLSAGLLEEDRSRSPHILSWGVRGTHLLGAVETRPVEVQDELLMFARPTS